MIRITRQADYGIVLMTRFAASPDRLFNAPEMAHDSQLPLPTVSKILKCLARAGLLVSHRGVKGGYSLQGDPTRLSVADVITAVDGPIAITECIVDTPGECDRETTCGVRGNWQRINVAVRSSLEGISLAAMVEPLPALVSLGGGAIEPTADAG